MITVNNPQQLKDKINLRCLCPMVRSVEKSDLKAFTALSEDQSPIHSTDSDSPVVPGNLLIVLLPAMLQSGLQVKTFAHCKTATLDKVRFYQSVGLNEPLQLSIQLLEVRTRGSNTFALTEMTLIRVKDAQKVLTASQTDCYVTQCV